MVAVVEVLLEVLEVLEVGVMEKVVALVSKQEQLILAVEVAVAASLTDKLVDQVLS